jgi:DNA mismatch endonuclease (patch repair protein)
MDRISPQQRSWTMSRVGSRDTAPEMLVRKAAHALGLRFRLHRGDLPGSPDLVFPNRRIALFVHGCFWHRHVRCKRASTPKSQTIYWTRKFERNVARDRRAVAELKALGWRPVVVWECQTKNREKLAALLERVMRPRRRRRRAPIAQRKAAPARLRAP